MKLAVWKRTILGAVVALSVAGSSLAPVVAGHAAAEKGDVYCSVHQHPVCQIE